MRRVLVLAVAFRLLTLTTPASLALAAELPVSDAGRPAAQDAGPLSPEHFLKETNADRAAAGLEPLRMSPELTRAAQSKAADMQANGYWDHFRPGDHKAPWDFIREAGYNYRVAGENLARGYRTAHGITEAWMQSPTHRANLLSPKYTEVGFAVVTVPGDGGRPVLVTVQMFGSR